MSLSSFDIAAPQNGMVLLIVVAEALVALFVALSADSALATLSRSAMSTAFSIVRFSLGHPNPMARLYWDGSAKRNRK